MSKSTGQRARRFAPIEERIEFHSIPEPNSGCTLWTGDLEGGRYPVLEVDGKRLSITRFLARTPAHLHALHKCDVTFCINKDHLYNGTPQDNTADMMRRGRDYRGIGNRRLSDDQIKTLKSDPRPARIVAAAYGIDRSWVYKLRGRTRGTRSGFA
jgi:hypothetical protein